MKLGWKYWFKMFWLILAVQVTYQLVTNDVFARLFKFWEAHQ